MENTTQVILITGFLGSGENHIFKPHHQRLSPGQKADDSHERVRVGGPGWHPH